MGALLFSHFRVTKVKLINEKNPVIKGLSKSAYLWTWLGKTGPELLLLVVDCITSFRLVSVHFESLRILVF